MYAVYNVHSPIILCNAGEILSVKCFIFNINVNILINNPPIDNVYTYFIDTK